MDATAILEAGNQKAIQDVNGGQPVPMFEAKSDGSAFLDNSDSGCIDIGLDESGIGTQEDVERDDDSKVRYRSTVQHH